jgi:hypothetical protein
MLKESRKILDTREKWDRQARWRASCSHGDCLSRRGRTCLTAVHLPLASAAGGNLWHVLLHGKESSQESTVILCRMAHAMHTCAHKAKMHASTGLACTA